MKNRQIDDVLNSYRRYMDQSVYDVSIRERKKAFLETQFQPEPFLGFQLLFLIPAALLITVFVWLQAYTPPKLVYIYPQPLKVIANEVKQSEIASSIASPRNDEKELGSELPVKVDRVNSQVGPTMVFQSNRNNVPITIVWVFTGG